MRITHLLGTAIAVALVPCGGAIASTGLAFRDSFGNLYIYGLQPYASVQVGLGTGKHPVVQLRKANGCGYVRISQATAATIQLPTNSGSLASFTTANLQTVQNPPMCKARKLYLASGWVWPTATPSTTTTTTATTGTTGTSTGSSGSGSIGSTSTVPAGYSKVTLSGVSKIGTAVVVSGLTTGGSYKLQLLAGTTPVYSGSLPNPDACGVSQGSVAALSSSTNYGYKILDSNSVTKYQGTLSSIPSLPYSVVQCISGQVYGKVLLAEGTLPL